MIRTSRFAGVSTPCEDGSDFGCMRPCPMCLSGFLGGCFPTLEQDPDACGNVGGLVGLLHGAFLAQVFRFLGRPCDPRGENNVDRRMRLSETSGKGESIGPAG